MKKCVLSIGVVFTLLVYCVMPAYAVSQSQYATLSTEQLAYCDIDKAPEVWRERILAARDLIIHSTSWTVDGQVEVVLEDGTVQQLPEFSDLFPGWDAPKSNVSASPAIVSIVRAANFVGNVYLQAPPPGGRTPVFYYFNPISNRITMGIENGNYSGNSWNGAYDDINTGAEVGFRIDMAKGAKLNLTNPNTAHVYGARASTYSTEDYAEMYVTENPM